MAEGLSAIEGYLQSDTDGSSASILYYGYLSSNSAWYIMQISTTNNVASYRYFAGSGLSNYQANWANRPSLIYDYYSNIFTNT
jgi:hypothetical protein